MTGPRTDPSVAPERSINLEPSAYARNRCVKIAPATEKGVSGFKVEAPIKGEGLRRTVVRSDAAPKTCRLLKRLLSRQDKERLTLEPDEFSALGRLGILVPIGQAPEPVLFSCNPGADSSPSFNSESVLERELADSAETEWLINPNVRIERRGDSPNKGQNLWRAVADLGMHDIIWVEDRCREVTLPYWLSDFESSCARKLISGELSPNRIDVDLRRTFWSIDLIQPHRCLSDNCRKWRRRLGDARESLEEKGYAVIQNLLPEVFLKSIRQYYRSLVNEGFLVFGDQQQALRYNLHNEPFGFWLHRQTQPLIARAVPEEIKCSYSYVAIYESGASLERHTDRIQCEYTLTLAIDATPDSTRSKAWPLYVEPPGEKNPVCILLGAGDGLILKGRELPHFRHRLDEGRTSSSLLFHYARADFEGLLLAGMWINAEYGPD